MSRQFGVLDTEVDNFLGALLKSELVTQEDKLKLTARGEEVLGKLWFTVENTEQKILSGFLKDETSVLLKQLHQVQEKCIALMNGN